MSVIRTRRSSHFTTVPNAVIRNPDLTLQAKMLLVLMLSFPDDWRYTLAHLRTLSKNGAHAHRTAFKELAEAGYVHRTVARDDDGRVTGYEYVVYDEPQTGVRFSDAGKADAGEADAGEPHATKTESTKTESTKTDKTKREHPKPEDTDLPSGVRREAWQADCQHRRELRKPLTPTATKRLLNLLRQHPKDANEMLDASIRNGWTGVFPLKRDTNGSTKRDERGTISFAEQARMRAERDPRIGQLFGTNEHGVVQVLGIEDGQALACHDLEPEVTLWLPVTDLRPVPHDYRGAFA